MTNEQLAVLAQGGNREALLKLWNQVERLVWKQARRWAGLGGTTVEDLSQAGFIAVLRTVDSFDPQKGKFSTWLFPILRAEFSAATGQQTARARRDPLQTAISADIPVWEDGEETALDFIPDPEAEDAYLAVEREELHDTLETALNTLSPKNRRVVSARYSQGQKLAEIAAAEGVTIGSICARQRTALTRLRNTSQSKRLEAFL